MIMKKKNKEVMIGHITEEEVALVNRRFHKQGSTMMMKISIKVKQKMEVMMKKKKKKKKRILHLIFTISQREEGSRLIWADHRNNKKWH